MSRFRWGYRGKWYCSQTLSIACPMCGAVDAVVKLPKRVLAEQHDGTTHVCHPVRGGCNQGFTLDVVPAVSAHSGCQETATNAGSKAGR